jgi:hypothetical protein
LVLLLTAGLRFPKTAALAGAVYVAGRIAYFAVRAHVWDQLQAARLARAVQGLEGPGAAPRHGKL